jgi:UDP-sugar pyrophosphorylase
MKWVYFFQDTNALAFKVLPATIGVSKRLSLEVNSVAVRRTPGESIGGLMRLQHQDGRQMTVNVEYNQIDALLKATVEPRGDVAGPDGFSPYPGSINQLLFALEPYARQLEKSGGGMPEFVNPKYTDSTKSAFKAPTRLECMMQDYPKSLGPKANVGFSVVSGALTFSPVKTNLADARVKSSAGEPTYSAASGEADVYASGCEMLAVAGVTMPPPVESPMSGIKVALGPRIVIDPTFAVGASKWREKLPTPSDVKITANSTLILEGELRGLRIESLHLSGTLILRVCAGANVTLKRVRVSNGGWAFEQLADGCEDESLAIRGYKLQKASQREMVFDKPGDYVIEDAEDESCAGP